MDMTHHKIELTAHHLTRFASTNPLEAVSELIWNGLDADADKVTVVTKFDVLQTMSGIVVSDNGVGIPFDEVVERFKRLGDSWKRSSRLSKKHGRFLHGKDGQGRFKALSLGRVVSWNIVYSVGSENFHYTVQLIADDPTDLIISGSPQKTSRPTGVTVSVTELNPTTNALLKIDALDRVGEKFALYLNQYRDVEINFCGSLIQPQTYIVSIEKFTLSPIFDDERTFEAEYDIVEWAVRSERRIYLCDAEGFPLAERNPRFHVPGLDFVGYIRSNYFAELAEKNIIDVDGLDRKVADILEQCKELTKRYYRRRRVSDTRSVIQKWKEEKVYPYEAEPQDDTQETERQVFDLVAVSVKDHIIDFDSLSATTKRFNFELLRQAIERNPTELRSVLEHVLKLPENKLAELASLLDDVTLSNIIEASATVTDRLTFIHGLEELVYNEQYSRDLLERTQLHQLVAQNIWLFGEQYNLTVSDKGLTLALRKHAKLTGDKKVIDRPVRRLDGSIGIVDLMLSRASKPMRSGEIEHLVIELKRPTVEIGVPQLHQAFSYAMAVAADERFSVGQAEWEFWIVSSGMTKEARALSNQADKPPGLYFDSGTSNPKVRVWARTWAEIIHDARVRMQFYKDRLSLEVDSEAAVRKLQRTYARYFEQSDEPEEVINEGSPSDPETE
jgi:hypothetical protein